MSSQALEMPQLLGGLALFEIMDFFVIPSSPF